jgi:ceramide glucosyltransferase
VSDRNDPSLGVVQRLLQDFPDHDAQLLVEDEDQVLKDGKLGPNPKIRNMSRAYREAVGDIIWVIDCNVWVAKGVCGRMVAKLDGEGTPYKNKFVHQLPLVVDIVGGTANDESRGLLNNTEDGDEAQLRTSSSASAPTQGALERTPSSIGGGRLEEAFMSSAHAKFYIAINTVLIAPCAVGKSTMFRRSHLNGITDGAGIDFFSENICEDHLIGDRLWKHKVPEELEGQKVGKHACLFGDMAIQPMANMSMKEYWSRRVRWLRVRKFTVTLATFVEPGTESFLCSAYGAFAFSTLPWFHNTFGIPQTWTAFVLLWLLSVTLWCAVDWQVYLKLHSGASFEVDEDTPFFAKPRSGASKRRFGEWLLAWLGRESLACPIWCWAFWGGTTVEWRGKRFWVGMDMKVHAITDEDDDVQSNGSSDGKARRD